MLRWKLRTSILLMASLPSLLIDLDLGELYVHNSGLSENVSQEDGSTIDLKWGPGKVRTLIGCLLKSMLCFVCPWGPRCTAMLPAAQLSRFKETAWKGSAVCSWTTHLHLFVARHVSAHRCTKA